MTDNVVQLFPSKEEDEPYDVVRITMRSDGKTSVWVVDDGLETRAQFLWIQENLATVGQSFMELRKEILGPL